MSINILNEPEVKLFCDNINSLKSSKKNILDVVKVCRQIESFKDKDSIFLNNIYKNDEWACLEHSDLIINFGFDLYNDKYRFYDLKNRIWEGNEFLKDNKMIVSGSIRDFLELDLYLKELKEKYNHYCYECEDYDFLSKLPHTIEWYYERLKTINILLEILNSLYESFFKDNNNLIYHYFMDYSWNILKPYVENKRITIKIKGSIAMARQLLRYRMFSPMQESTRYVNYSKDMNLQYFGLEDKNEKIEIIEIFDTIKNKYNEDLENKKKKEIARKNLPLSLSSEVYITARLKDWKHFIKQRTTNHAEAEIRYVAEKVKIIVEEIEKRYKSNE